MARAAAVLGEGARADVGALAGLDERSAELAADALAAAEVLRQDGSQGFVHPLVRAAVTDELQAGARADLHRRAAAHLHAVGASAEVVGRHLLATDPTGAPWAPGVLTDAARFAAERGAPEVAVGYLERALDESPPDADRSHLLHELGWLVHWAGHPRALEWLERAALESHDANAQMRARLDVQYVSGYKGPPRVRKHVIALLGVLSDSVRLGSPVMQQGASVSRANVHLRLGNLAEAEADIWAALRTANEFGFASGLPWKLAVLTDILRECGEPTRAETALAEHDWLYNDPPQHVYGLLLAESRARLHLAQGRTSAAFDDFAICGKQLDAAGYRSSAMFTWRAGAALCLTALGEQAEAERLAAEQVSDARQFGAAPWLGSSLRALGVARGGEEGIASLREAVDVLDASDARLEFAHALCELGVLLRHNRRPREAREPLRQALDLAGRCGAHALAARATEELSAAGARPRGRAISGADSLTAAERRVASLAAQGKSNPEIAQSLFVTRKTVEKHLGNAFLKLQISARSQLTDALATDR